MSLTLQADGSAVQPRPLRIEFTGSGSEYFRIWIVNLLLIVVTLGLYLPFAKARRLRYFYGNTVVDGHALSFTGDAWRMFRGFLLLGALALAYGLAGRVSPAAGVFAFVLLAALWPALWRSSLRFRLGNTSWRGLRLAFRGSVGGAYMAMLPFYLPLFLMVLPQAFVDPEHPETMKAVAGAMLWTVGLGFAAALAFYPLAFAWAKRYQHGGYACANQQTQLFVPTSRFYGLCFKTVGLYLAAMLAFFLLGIVAALAVGAISHFGKPDAANAKQLTLLLSVGIGLLYVLLLALIGPYFTARAQNLVWSGTASVELQFRSALRVRSLAWLTIKNWLLTAITLSLYRPFAAVATARMRLEAVSLELAGDVDQWVASQDALERDASGDAAGDFFGIDLGL